MVNLNDDDTGLPESPIYSNFVKHLWKSHTQHEMVQSPHRFLENTDDLRAPQAKMKLSVNKLGSTEPLF